MKLITKDADLRCSHKGKVIVGQAQSFVTIEGVPVLVQGDLAAKAIRGCVNAAAAPCPLTLPPGGHSALVHIDGTPVCLDRNLGATAGIGVFKVEDPAQNFVESDS